MKNKYLILFVLLSSCSYQKIPYVLQSGEVVRCSFVHEEECGAFIAECDDDRVHYCQQNVSQLKESGPVKKLIYPFEEEEPQPNQLASQSK